MSDLEKRVIRGLECHICPTHVCGNCGYFIRNENDPDTGWCDRDTIYRDALSLLKAQEPKLVPDIAEAMLGYRLKVRVGHCPSCGVLMSETDKFCRKCGQAVKWE